MSEYNNSRKEALFLRLPTTSIESEKDNLTEKCKFNFHYMDFQPAGQNFQDWENAKQLAKLLDKIKFYCAKPLKHWTYQKIGSGAKRGNVLEIYGNKFPNKSDFISPKHVPNEALWARFRLEWDARLIGFVIPYEYHGRYYGRTKEYYDCNTFYVVFLDKDHKFCKSEK